MRYIVAYDVSDDDRRARLAAVCAAYGDRIQRSVFECTLDPLELDEMVQRASLHVAAETDSLHIVPVCATCHQKRIVIGQAEIPPEVPWWVV
jgi:CRISPR-associated protein Cas2